MMTEAIAILYRRKQTKALPNTFLYTILKISGISLPILNISLNFYGPNKPFHAWMVYGVEKAQSRPSTHANFSHVTM